MEDIGHRLRKKIAGMGHPVLSEDELERYRGMDCIGDRRVVLADLERRSVKFQLNKYKRSDNFARPKPEKGKKK